MNKFQNDIELALSRTVCAGWDRGFLESILAQILKKKALSNKQRKMLSEVLQRTDESSQLTHNNWATEYEKKYRDDATALAKYHQRQPYYRAMSSDIISNKVPDRNKFLKMHANRYSQKVLEQHRATPKYNVGDYLVVRASFDSYKCVELEGDLVWSSQNKIVQGFENRGGFVLEIKDGIRSAAKGAKRYKLLPVGGTTPLVVEERYLKKARRGK
jgi:hypothetical protein